ncbi:hypothetical protein [Streptomyces sp. HD]|nr:hypothetical protein [Streptomyces sp. HD]MDC0769342.1 hypothetical protein [Streptomyces sp. HD]
MVFSILEILDVLEIPDVRPESGELFDTGPGALTPVPVVSRPVLLP